MPPDSQLVVDASARASADRAVSAPALARGLVSSCLVESARESEVLSFDSPDDERFRFVARPALDEPDRRQLRGCLEDLRVPRLIVDVHSMSVEMHPA